MNKGNWEDRISNQIIVYKTNNGLLEMQNCLRPAPKKYPWHIHADGKEEGYSRIRLVAVDYSKKGKSSSDRGYREDGKPKSVSVYANLDPEQIKYLFCQLCLGFENVVLEESKFFAGEAGKDGTATYLYICREEYKDKAKKEKWDNPWVVYIKNGTGLAVRNRIGGLYYDSKTYKETGHVTIRLTDEAMFGMLSRTCTVIQAFEQKHLYRERDSKNFQNLFKLIKRELDQRLPDVSKTGQRYDKAA